MSESYSHWGMFPAVERYEDGEAVSLLTGGPAMTVVGRAGGTATLVAWFDDDNKLQHALFPAAALYSIEYDDEDTIGPCAGSC